MDVTLESNRIVIPVIGTKFGVRKSKAGVKQHLEIVDGNDENTFAILFDDDNVDFEITVDNKNNDRGMKYKLTINDRSAVFHPKPKGYHNLQTMMSNGRKFHFLSQRNEHGSKIVQQIADDRNMTNEEAVVCASQIHFEVEIEKQKTDERPKARHGYYRKLQSNAIGLKNELSAVKNDETSAEIVELRQIDDDDEEGSAHKERGVVAFAGKCDQIFGEYKEIFVTDKQLKINPFTLELRMKAEQSMLTKLCNSVMKLFV